MSLDRAETNPTAEQCEALLGEIFREFFDDENLIMRPEMTARDVDGWDSLAHVRLLLTIERKYQIRFSTPEVGGLRSVGDLASLITRKTNAR
jgi:acyl carrier protein